MTAPEPDDSTVTVPTVEEFRNFVNADPSDDDDLKRDLDSAVELVDEFCRDPQRPVPAATRRRWYLLVGAELFDASSGPSTSTDPFGNSRQSRPSRDPLHVIMRQARRFVSPF
ncbi:hypothetical protein A2J03_08145 [Rhodococcus sp. EPR-157]|uniref:hypothetical protein n=1 Tax=Rhodococcus sp. EPR-157 TaxID=1813677 RepID=UPI0007BC56BB|nr:hypothetical protein [Rhodococcus sp. EPR-157]KZF03227.1 hypothetical protein A2J03_08145 [Rhodococcus sp. EPR-157]